MVQDRPSLVLSLDVLERGREESEITFKHMWVFAYVNIEGKSFQSTM